MIKMMEGWGDRLLGLVVPNVTAKAEPCECSGVWTREIDCYCVCGAGSFGTMLKRQQRCSGCRASYGPCYSTWSLCIC